MLTLLVCKKFARDVFLNVVIYKKKKLLRKTPSPSSAFIIHGCHAKASNSTSKGLSKTWVLINVALNWKLKLVGTFGPLLRPLLDKEKPFLFIRLWAIKKPISTYCRYISKIITFLIRSAFYACWSNSTVTRPHMKNCSSQTVYVLSKLLSLVSPLYPLLE